MYQTLFHIPGEIGGLPVFGFGILLALWVVFSVGLMIYLLRTQGATPDTWGYVPVVLIVAAVIWFVLPRLLKAGGLPIQGYGTMLLVAIVSSLSLVVWRARQRGMDPDLMLSLAFWSILPGLIGARIFYVVEYWAEFQRPTLAATVEAMINLTEGGIVVYGGFIGGLVGMTVYLTRRRMPKLKTFDVIAPGVMLGLALGRIGCMLNGCCYGDQCDLPWAVTFPSGSHVHLHQIKDGAADLHGLKILGSPDAAAVVTAVVPGSDAEKAGLQPGDTLLAINGWRVHSVQEAVATLLQAHEMSRELVVTTTRHSAPLAWEIHEPLPRPVHPTQIYSAINAFLLMFVLLAAERWWVRRDGQVFALLVTLYPIARFLIEIARNDEGGQFGTALTISQWVSIGMLLFAVGVWTYTIRQPARVESHARPAGQAS